MDEFQAGDNVKRRALHRGLTIFDDGHSVDLDLASKFSGREIGVCRRRIEPLSRKLVRVLLLPFDHPPSALAPLRLTRQAASKSGAGLVNDDLVI